MDRVAELASEQGASLYEIIRNADLFPVLKSAASKLLKFADLIDNLRRAGATLALPEFYDEVLRARAGTSGHWRRKTTWRAGAALRTCRN